MKKRLLENPLNYPNWVKKRLTPNLEDTEPLEVQRSILWIHNRQIEPAPHANGQFIYKYLLPDQKTYKPKKGDLILRCVSLFTLRCYENNPHLIPKRWGGRWLHAWKSVV